MGCIRTPWSSGSIRSSSSTRRRGQLTVDVGDDATYGATESEERSNYHGRDQAAGDCVFDSRQSFIVILERCKRLLELDHFNYL
jgi:hypothetical protein